MNVVSLVGRLGRDPELRYSQSGTPFCRFPLAVNRRVNGNENDPEPREETLWVDIVAFSRLAEVAGEYLSKGRRVAVNGRLACQRVERQVGTENIIYRTYEVVASSIEFLDAPAQQAEQTEPAESATQTTVMRAVSRPAAPTQSTVRYSRYIRTLQRPAAPAKPAEEPAAEPDQELEDVPV